MKLSTSNSDSRPCRRVLISGAGIAGPTLAYWLCRFGFETTIVERSPSLRTGGYIIDFWGAGYDVAERMELRSELQSVGYVLQEVRAVDRAGKRVSGFSADVFSRITQGRYISIQRGDLAAAIFGALKDRVETIWGDSIARIEQTPGEVQVTFASGVTRTFDLVVGADGLHSNVRKLVFGNESKFERYLGYKVAAFSVRGYRPRDELVYVMHTEVGQQVSRFSMRGDATMFLFTFADDDPAVPSDETAQKDVLRARFGGSGWECPRILDSLDDAEDLYFDRVSQIRMGPEQGMWSRGRVTLIGDAAFCVSLLAGQGSALAMCAAYILAGELSRNAEQPEQAFARYEELLSSFLLKKQDAALRFAGAFAPHSALSLSLRNTLMKLFRVRWIANLAFGRDLRDRIPLPDY